MMAGSPCALAVAPLTYATAISACARKVMVEGSCYDQANCFPFAVLHWMFSKYLLWQFMMATCVPELFYIPEKQREIC